jgi:hypothetical protein
MTRSDSLFAPVASQQQARLDRLARLGARTPTTGDVEAMLDAGRSDTALVALARATGTGARSRPLCGSDWRSSGTISIPRRSSRTCSSRTRTRTSASAPCSTTTCSPSMTRVASTR